MKSRSLTASMLFGQADAKPRSAASAARSMGKGQPASAPEPSGETFTRRARSLSRSASRCHGHAWLNNQWLQRTGCAGWTCV